MRKHAQCRLCAAPPNVPTLPNQGGVQNLGSLGSLPLSSLQTTILSGTLPNRPPQPLHAPGKSRVPGPRHFPTAEITTSPAVPRSRPSHCLRRRSALHTPHGPAPHLPLLDRPLRLELPRLVRSRLSPPEAAQLQTPQLHR